MNAPVLVVNPTAGGGRARAALPAVATALRTGPGGSADLEVVESRSLDHAVGTASAAARDGRLVVALGGDGLVGALAGAVAAEDGLLGVVPGGRGNDIVRTLGLPRDPVAAARAVLRGGERRVDLGEAGGRTFAGIASVGFDGEANAVANASRVVRGRLVYPYATVRVLRSWRPAGFRVTVDGTAYDYVGYMVSVANVPYYGGGMRVAPQAEPDDGLLDVVMSHHVSKARFLLTAPKVFSGRHVEEPFIRVARGSVVHVEADRPFTVYADGDPLCALPTTVTVRAGALRVVTGTG